MNDIKKMILTRGPSCSGKTTWAEQFCIDNPDWKNINRDDIRYAEFGRYTDVHEGRVTYLQTEAFKEYAANGFNVIISDTNLNPNTVDFWQRISITYNYSFEIKDFLGVSLNELYERNNGRQRKVNKDVIRRQYTQHRELTFAPYEPILGLPLAYMFDVDGTLAWNLNGRSPYDHTRVMEDSPNRPVGNVARSLFKAGFKIIIMTGRVKASVLDTAAWLIVNDIHYHKIFARPDGNTEKDSIVKYDLFNKYVANKYNVLGVFDDRNQVVNMWRKIGLTCFQVAEGDF